MQAVENKAVAIRSLCASLNIDAENTMFVGNDINDIAAFKFVSIPVAVADAYPEVMEHVVFKTSRPGGFGAVREICDLIYFAKTKS